MCQIHCCRNFIGHVAICSARDLGSEVDNANTLEGQWSTPANTTLCFHLLHLGSNLVLQDCGWVTDAHRAGGRCFGIVIRPPRPQPNSSVTNLYWAPGPKGRVGLPSHRCTCPLFSLLREPVGTFGQFMMKTGKAGTGLGTFWWDGEEGRSIGVRASLQIGSLSWADRESQKGALEARDILTLKTGDQK